MLFILLFTAFAAAQRYPSSNAVLARNLGLQSHYAPHAPSQPYYRRQASTPAPAEDPPLAKFGDVVPILGRMERTDQDYVDGLAIDLFSPSNRTFSVQQNFRPLPGNFVTGSTGETFMALSNYSYVIKVNDTARDLIAKVELPYDPVRLSAMGLDPANTYVGQLSPDKTSWIIDETRRNVHVSENKTRIIKMVSLDGEYLLLARKNIDVANVFLQYGQGATRTANFTGGPGVQETEFVDGLRFSVVSQQPFQMNVDLKFGLPSGMVPAGMSSLYSFTWVINTTNAQNASLSKADVIFPINEALLNRAGNNSANIRVVPAKRSLGAVKTRGFSLLENRLNSALKIVAHPDGTRIQAAGMQSLDGEYILLVDGAAKGNAIEAEGRIGKDPLKA